MKRAVAPSSTCLVAIQMARGPLGDGFAQARCTHQRQRTGLLDKGRVEIAQHQLALKFRAEPKVELFYAGGEGKASLAEPALAGGGGTGGRFLFEQALQHLGVGQVFTGGTVEPRRQHGRSVVQSHLVKERSQID